MAKDYGGYMDDDESSPSTAGTDTMDKPKDKSDETEDQLALIPRSFFPNPDEAKPGTQWIVEVVNVYEGEVAIKYAYDEEKEEKEEKGEGDDEMGGKYESSEDEMMA